MNPRRVQHREYIAKAVPKCLKLPGVNVLIRQISAARVNQYPVFGGSNIRRSRWRGCMIAPAHSPSGQFEIYILESLSDRMKLKVFAHEMIHVMNDYLAMLHLRVRKPAARPAQMRKAAA